MITVPTLRSTGKTKLSTECGGLDTGLGTKLVLITASFMINVSFVPVI